MAAFLCRIVFLLTSTLVIGATCLGDEPSRHRVVQLPASEYLRTRESANLDGNRQPTKLDPLVERFKVATDGDLLLLPVKLQGKRYWFALDTGASHSLYDTSLRSILSDPIKTEKVRGFDGDRTVPIFRSPAGTLGKLKLPTDSYSFCMDLGKLREVSGQEFYGLLGMDFLKKHVFRIDFDHGEVTFLHKVDRDPGERIPILFRGNDPHVLLEAQGLIGRGRFLVDTGHVGSDSGNLQSEAFALLAKRGFLTLERQAPSETLSGSQKVRFGCLDSITLGCFRHEKLLFIESNRNVLGLGYLSRYIVTFDFPNSVMYLKKGRQFDRPELRDRSGLDIRRKEGQTIVESVDEDSPSARAAVKPQDELVKIDNVKSSEISLWRIRRLLSEKGKKYRLRLRRGDKELELTIHLRE